MDTVIFDFDGVIADSEVLGNQVLAESLTALGAPTTLDQALATYQGKRWPDVVTLIEARLGHPLPQDFADIFNKMLESRLAADLQEVSGATHFIRGLGQTRRAIASSSSMARLRLCLDRLGLADAFADKVYSADLVTRGKPYPDIFLFAAAELGASPSSCLVIEDSPSGVKAAKAAGMAVAGLCAASHLRAGHRQRLLDAGADRVFDSWTEIGDSFYHLSRPPSGPNS